MKSIVGIVLLAVLVAAAVAGFACLKLGLSMNADIFGVDTAWPSASVAEPQNVKAENENNDAPKKEHLITVTIVGAGKEFDGKRFGDQLLKWWQKRLTRQMRKVALSRWKYAPLEEAETMGDHLIVVTVRGTGEEFDGVYFRDDPLDEWEKELARTLIKLAEENDGGFIPPPDPEKSDEKK